MREIFKMIGSLIIIALFLGHFLLLGLILAPVNKLLGLTPIVTPGFVIASDIPNEVVHFLKDYRVPVKGNYVFEHSSKSKIIAGILEFREAKTMNDTQVLALEMNLLDYGNGITGMEAAADYFFRRPLSELSAKEWITLVNLHGIFSKK